MRIRTTLAVGLAVGAALTLGARELPAFFGELIGTTVVKASDLKPIRGRVETLSTYINAPTSTLLNLGLSVATLAPGASPTGRPYSNAHESVILVSEGVLEVKLDEKGSRVERLDAGSVVFLAPNQWHELRNATTSPVSYYEFDWISPGMNGEPNYPEAVVNRRRLPQQ